MATEAIKDNLLSYSPNDLAEKCQDWTNPEIDQAIISSARRMRNFALAGLGGISVEMGLVWQVVDRYVKTLDPDLINRALDFSMISFPVAMVSWGFMILTEVRCGCRQSVLENELKSRQPLEFDLTS